MSGGIPDGVSLIAVGGTNIDTGLPNTLTLLAPPGGRLLNPVTTLIEFARDLSGVDTAEASDRIAAALGLETGIDFLTYDPLAQPPDDPTALAVQKAAVQVAVVAGAIGNSAVNLARIAVLAADAEQALDLTQAATLAAMLEIETDDPLVALVAAGLGAIDQATTLSAVAEAQAAATVALDLAILPGLSISTETVSVEEGDVGSTALVFRVERTGDVAAESSVRWSVEGDPVDASDFVGGVLPSGALDFAGGETSKTITVAVVGDTMFEGDEAVTVRLSEASGARIDAATARITVLNDDALPRLSIAPTDANRAEGDDGTTEYTFTVTRTGDTSIASSAAWAVSSANATGTDFVGGVLPSGTVSFAIGETSRTITVAVAGDTESETDEAFSVTLTAPSGATLGISIANGTIVNDDEAVIPGDTVTGTPDNDPALTGGAGNDTINGLAGADTLTGARGDDRLDGGAGSDTAIFTGPASRYTLSFDNADYPWRVTDSLAGGDGTDLMRDIERLQFTDRTVILESRAPRPNVFTPEADREQPFANLPSGLYKYFIIAFDAAPGVTYLEQMAEAYYYWLPREGGGNPVETVRQIVEVFTTKTQFTDAFPEAFYRATGTGQDVGYFLHRYDEAGRFVPDTPVTREIFLDQMGTLAQRLVTQIVKQSASEEARAGAKDAILQALDYYIEDPSWTIGNVIYTIFGNLSSKTPDIPDYDTWKGTAAQFANQVAVAQYYTEVMQQSTTDLATLRDVIAPVDQNTPVTPDAVIAELIGQALMAG